jgi:hypothetical protein
MAVSTPAKNANGRQELPASSVPEGSRVAAIGSPAGEGGKHVVVGILVGAGVGLDGLRRLGLANWSRGPRAGDEVGEGVVLLAGRFGGGSFRCGLQRRGLRGERVKDLFTVGIGVTAQFGGKVRAEGTCGELLEQQDLTNLQTDRLPADALAEIEAVLAKRGLGLRSVEQPRRRLESLFLEIVDTARKEGTHTSGARSGGQIADFLRAGATEAAGDAEGEEVLDKLAAKAATPQPAPTVTDQAASREEDDTLAELVARPASQPTRDAPAEATGQAPAPRTVEAASGPDEDPDDDVLASLTRR